MANRIKQRSRHRAQRQAAASEDDRQPAGWQFSRSDTRLEWWDAGRSKSSDFASMGTAALMVFQYAGGLLLIGWVVTVVLILITSWVKGFPVEYDSALDLFLIMLGITSLMAIAAMVTLACSADVFRFEIDLEKQEITLHEAVFPNRSRIVVVPFSQVEHIRPIASPTSPPYIELVVMDGKKSTNRWIGSELDEATVNAHMTWLVPALGGKVLPRMDVGD